MVKAKPYNERIFEVTCCHCRAMLTYNSRDIQTKKNFDVIEGWYQVRAVTCPLCDYWTKVRGGKQNEI